MFDFDEEPLNNVSFYPASHDQPIRTDVLSSVSNPYSVNSMWSETFIDTRIDTCAWSTTKYIQVSLIMKSYLRSKFRDMAEQYMKSKGIGLLW